MPLSATGISPPHLNLGLHGTVAEIDYDQASFVILQPGPGHQVLKACVIRPARSVAQAPLTFTENGPIDSLQELHIEALQVPIHNLIWTPAQKHGRPYLATFKLPFMK